MRYNKIEINFCFGLILVVILQILASMPLIHASADGGGGSIVYIGRDNDNIVYAVNPDGTNNKKIYSVFDSLCGFVCIRKTDSYTQRNNIYFKYTVCILFGQKERGNKKIFQL